MEGQPHQFIQNTEEENERQRDFVKTQALTLRALVEVFGIKDKREWMEENWTDTRAETYRELYERGDKEMLAIQKQLLAGDGSHELGETFLAILDSASSSRH